MPKNPTISNDADDFAVNHVEPPVPEKKPRTIPAPLPEAPKASIAETPAALPAVTPDDARFRDHDWLAKEWPLASSAAEQFKKLDGGRIIRQFANGETVPATAEAWQAALDHKKKVGDAWGIIQQGPQPPPPMTANEQVEARRIQERHIQRMADRIKQRIAQKILGRNI